MSLRLYREKPGIISDKSCWVAVDPDGPWLYADNSFLRLLYQLLTEWRSDRHLVG